LPEKDTAGWRIGDSPWLCTLLLADLTKLKLSLKSQHLNELQLSYQQVNAEASLIKTRCRGDFHETILGWFNSDSRVSTIFDWSICTVPHA